MSFRPKTRINQALLDKLNIKEGCCSYCGVRMSMVSGEKKLTIDHVIPRSNGGTDCILNRIPCCDACNKWKADNSLEYFRKQVLAKLESGFGFPNRVVRRWFHMAIHIPQIDKMIQEYKKEIFAHKKVPDIKPTNL